MMIKRFLLFIAVIFMVSCSNEDRNKIPSITPNKIELSTAHPEGFFQFIREFGIRKGLKKLVISSKIRIFIGENQ